MLNRLPRLIALSIACLLVSGCSSLIASQTGKLADGLSAAVLDSEDLATVEQGAPSYLLLIDGLINNSPNDAALLSTGAQLNGAYAAAFVDDEVRSKLMVNKSFDYASRAACVAAKLCDVQAQNINEFTEAVSRNTDIASLYSLGVAWIGWLQVNSDDWNAIAQLPKATKLMERVLELDGNYEQGNVHLYLGGLATLLPPAMGGKPEVGRKHFESAIDISEGKNLLAKVVYAQQYARLVFDQALHDRLLTEVLSSDANTAGLTLTNLVAQREAKRLLEESAEYF